MVMLRNTQELFIQECKQLLAEQQRMAEEELSGGRDYHAKVVLNKILKTMDREDLSRQEKPSVVSSCNDDVMSYYRALLKHRNSLGSLFSFENVE